MGSYFASDNNNPPHKRSVVRGIFIQRENESLSALYVLV